MYPAGFMVNKLFIVLSSDQVLFEESMILPLGNVLRGLGKQW